MLGTRGVPARYGGFETAAEEIGSRLVEAGNEVVVYCRNPGQAITEHRGMILVNLPALRTRSLETLSHTGLSVLHVLLRSRPDVVILFNAANAPFLPLLRAARLPTAVHLDGLESQRAKWAGLGRRYFRTAERWSVRLADELIADARGVADHVKATYGRDSTFIPYGAPIVRPGSDRLAELGLEPGGYHLVVARMEPENHLEMIVEGYEASRATRPLVVVGSAPYADRYRQRVMSHASERVRFVGAVWDQGLLDQLYANAASYLHGHSVGGTNPSLLRAMGAGTPVTAYDVGFNREVAGETARFFGDAAGVAEALAADEADLEAAARRGEAGRQHAATTYVWDEVATSYAALCRRLLARRGRRRARRGRRCR
jgi:glycosyltransferase involved in cell wall biosynthesis